MFCGLQYVDRVCIPVDLAYNICILTETNQNFKNFHFSATLTVEHHGRCNKSSNFTEEVLINLDGGMPPYMKGNIAVLNTIIMQYVAALW